MHRCPGTCLPTLGPYYVPGQHLPASTAPAGNSSSGEVDFLTWFALARKSRLSLLTALTFTQTAQLGFDKGIKLVLEILGYRASVFVCGRSRPSPKQLRFGAKPGLDAHRHSSKLRLSRPNHNEAIANAD